MVITVPDDGTFDELLTGASVVPGVACSEVHPATPITLSPTSASPSAARRGSRATHLVMNTPPSFADIPDARRYPIGVAYRPSSAPVRHDCVIVDSCDPTRPPVGAGRFDGFGAAAPRPL